MTGRRGRNQDEDLECSDRRASLAVDKLAFLTTAENSLRDLRGRYLGPAQGRSPNVALVAITEDTLEAFPYRHPIDRRFLAGLDPDRTDA